MHNLRDCKSYAGGGVGGSVRETEEVIALRHTYCFEPLIKGLKKILESIVNSVCFLMFVLFEAIKFPYVTPGYFKQGIFRSCRHAFL